MKKNFSRILVVSLSNIGDVILTLPVMNVLKGNFPQAALSVVIGPKAQALLDGNPFFEAVYCYDKHADIMKKWRFIRELRRQKFDLVIDLKNTAIPFLIGARTFNWPRLKKKKRQYMGDQHLQALDFLSLDHRRQAALTLYDDADYRAMLAVCAHYGIAPAQVSSTVIMAPAARSSFKSWPVEKFAGLCRLVRDRYSDYTILLIGSPEETAVVGQVAAHAGKAVIAAAGAFSLKQCAALIDHAALLVSNDSAAMHMAHYLNRPVVAIFGPTDPVKYGKNSETSVIVVSDEAACLPCEDSSCKRGRECLTQLEVEEVFEQVRMFLRA